MKLPFADDSFDAVTVGYGLRNLASWEAGLEEMIRVARPGGRVVVLDFGKPDHALWRAFYFGYLRLCVPVFGLLFAGNITRQPYMAGQAYRIAGDLANTDLVMNNTLWIGLYPGLSQDMLTFVTERIHHFCSNSP